MGLLREFIAASYLEKVTLKCGPHVLWTDVLNAI